MGIIRHSNVNIGDYICYHKPSLKNHVESVHEKEKTFICEICDYSCSQKPNLKRHVESVHDKIKPYKCKIYDYSFSQMTTHHEPVHNNERPLKYEVPEDFLQISIVLIYKV